MRYNEDLINKRYQELGNAIVIRAYRDVVNWYLIRKRYPLTDEMEFGRRTPHEDYFRGYPTPHTIAKAKIDAKKMKIPYKKLLERRRSDFRKHRIADYYATIKDGKSAEAWFSKGRHQLYTEADGVAILRRAEKRADELIELGKDKEDEW